VQQFLENYGGVLAILATVAVAIIAVLALIRFTSGATEFDPALEHSEDDREPGL
jgi:hypothetical protein